MKTVLLPVKTPSEAKQRLASVLTPQQREGLARAMLADVLSAIAAAHSVERAVIFTASDEVIAMSTVHGFETVREAHVGGHSAAVNRMVTELSSTASRILAIAADLPRLTGHEIDFVLNSAHEPITIISSHDGTGTNGLMFIPPARIDVEYGIGSFRRHLSKAAAAGIRVETLSVPGMEFDVDTPDDLRVFLDDPRKEGETWGFLASLR